MGILTVNLDDGGDVVVGDFVRPVWGGLLGFVESVREDSKTKASWATMLIVANAHGHREIIETKNLRRACYHI